MSPGARLQSRALNLVYAAVPCRGGDPCLGRLRATLLPQLTFCPCPFAGPHAKPFSCFSLWAVPSWSGVAFTISLLPRPSPPDPSELPVPASRWPNQGFTTSGSLEMLSARHLPEGIIPALPPPHLGSCLGFAPQSSQCPQSGSFLSRCQAFSRQRGASEAGLGAMMQPPCHGYPGVRPPWVPGWEPLSVTQNQHSLGETLTCPCFR